MVTGLKFAADVYFMGQSVPGLGPNTPLPNPATFSLTEQEFAHDVLRMDFWGGDVDSQSLTTGTPIKVVYGRPPQMRVFYGYVNHAGRTNNQLAQTREGRNAVCVFSVGASWPMKDDASNRYQGLSNTQIISQIASQFGLGQYIVPYPSITGPVKQQGGLSYWQFCVQLAQEIGYTFYCDGIQLVAKPRQTDPNNLTSLAAVFDYKVDPGSLPVFNPTMGANNPSGGQLRNRLVAGVDMRTAVPYVSTLSGSGTSSVLGVQQEAPPFTEIDQFTSRNASEAATKLAGMGQANQMYLTATAVGSGLTQVSPGQLIFVKNANGSQNGLWFVTKVEHHMSETNYVMTIDLGRDSIGQTANLSIVPQISLPEEEAVLVGNTWLAAAA